ncbi:MAG: hypothetical protein ABI947_21685 [Chloroflexota bacterium]
MFFLERASVQVYSAIVAQGSNHVKRRTLIYLQQRFIDSSFKLY